ncbi:hypothetical protein MVES1_002998 [Malassezia vespertilionis]|uniref:Haloacid dehalogenase-like hydrolase n=1 Tax=Malassezia vespertilionis TaxID=2020962 RepID=A0A2N1J9N8_9BASI|nr:uncharacterized protein MVES1_002998 [Malassezia vespertilionis]PKI83264.1 hypothetical protein MVES_002839 [Malassezia vespertilionis]WFD07629.1 hypothetical protein MVES1_002998 [Malassezia vespertilionis]
MQQPALLFLTDWDGTITEHDTLSLVAPTDTQVQDGKNTFAYYENMYQETMSKFKDDYGPIDSENTLREYIGDVLKAEKITLNKIIEDGLFQGIRGDELRSRVSQVAFRPGWDQIQAWICAHTPCDCVHAYIISINWSRQFIHEALLLNTKEKQGVDCNTTGFEGILANEVEECTGICTGRIVGPNGAPPLLTGIDKLNIFRDIRSQYVKEPITLYLGDSVPDLLCLLEADVAIIMGNNPSLLKALDDSGLSLCMRTIANLRDVVQHGNLPDQTMLVRTNTWCQVMEIITVLTDNIDALCTLRAKRRT